MGRVMYVGDPHQAIYGFSGSDSQSMETMFGVLQDTKQGIVSLPLTITRRCPVLVTAYARKIVPEIECLPDTPEGRVCLGSAYLKRTSSEGDWYKYEIVKYPEEEHTYHVGHDPLTAPQSHCSEECYTTTIPGICPDGEAHRGDMVLCRTNAPIVQLAYKFIRENKPCKIQGRDIGQGLADRIKKLVPSTATTEQLEDAVDVWYQKEYAHILKNFANSESRLENALSSLQDKVDCIKALSEGLNTVNEVLSRISVLFADVEKGNQEGFILLSTIHKAKGMEARTVRVIRPDLLGVLGKLPWQKQQETNLEYVAYTRSLDTLHIHD